MRKILFRGKRVNNGEWVEGNLFIPDIPNTPTQICVGTNVVRISFDVDPETLSEYTGLTDKNGVKIFEGDIVKHEQRYDVSGVKTSTATIKWNNAYTCWSIEYTNGRATAILGCEKHRIEVIGNIHDNPKLLKEVIENE